MMGGLLEKEESVLDTGKFMNKNSTSHMRKHITIIEDWSMLTAAYIYAHKWHRYQNAIGGMDTEILQR